MEPRAVKLQAKEVSFTCKLNSEKVVVFKYLMQHWGLIFTFTLCYRIPKLDLKNPNIQPRRLLNSTFYYSVQ